jgi:hypothetical protein
MLFVVNANMYYCVKGNEGAKSQTRQSMGEAAKQKALALARDTCGELRKVNTREFSPMAMDLVVCIVMCDTRSIIIVAYCW